MNEVLEHYTIVAFLVVAIPVTLLWWVGLISMAAAREERRRYSAESAYDRRWSPRTAIQPSGSEPERPNREGGATYVAAQPENGSQAQGGGFFARPDASQVGGLLIPGPYGAPPSPPVPVPGLELVARDQTAWNEAINRRLRAGR